MKVKCTGPRCRVRFEAKSSRARFCSSTCRSRARRAAAKGAAAGVLPGEPPAPVDGTPTVGGKRKSLPLVTAVVKELREAKCLEKVDGQIAVLLAEQAAVATGSNAATLTKQLREVLDRATAGARPPAPDPEPTEQPDEPDEVTAARERREQKARAAAGRA